MSSPFLFRLRVAWSKNGKATESVIPIYAFKPGFSGWDRGDITMDTLRINTMGADGRRILTVSTMVPYAHRELINRSITYFELHVKDTRIRTAPTEERRTVATITCRDMQAGNMVSVSRDLIQMSCEPLAPEMVAVDLDFRNYSGGLVFAQV